MKESDQRQFSKVLVALFKGVTYEDADLRAWQDLLSLQTRVREYVGHLGLELILDEAEGYAFLRQQTALEDDSDVLPRLVPRRQLGYAVSLILALLRKKLAEFDAKSGDTKLILSREEILDTVRVFLPEQSNEARLVDRLDSHLTKIVEMGFLRRLREGDRFEVCRILKSFVDAQWLSGFEERLAAYRENGEGIGGEAEKDA